jgi:hypothetical protein
MVLFLSAEDLASFNHRPMRWMRLGHEFMAAFTIMLVAGHIYARLVKTQWPKVRAMIDGGLARRDFEAEHDWRRWQPPPADAPPEERHAQHRREARELPDG